MHILLINVGTKSEVRIPQGLLYLASALDAMGRNVTIYDEALETDSGRSIEKILDFRADIIGLTVYSVPWQLKRAEKISRAIKRYQKAALVVWGGWHPTLYPEYSIRNENVDVVVRGPGEKPFCDFVNAVAKKIPMGKVRNIMFKQENQIVDTGTESIESEYLFPPLNFELINIDAYLSKHDIEPGTLQYITTRGCHGKCSFCVMSHPRFRIGLVRKSTDQIVNELGSLCRNHEINSVHFSDDSAFRNNREAIELCDIIRQITNNKKFRWRCAARIDTLSRLHESTFKRIAADGCKGLVVGIESGVNRVLQLMNKNITEAQIDQALNSMSKYGLKENLFFFLFNFPGERKDEALKSLRLAREIRLSFPEANIALSVYFPGYAHVDWLPKNISSAASSDFSKYFDNYYDRKIRNYRLAGINLRILRYYFGASKDKNTTDFKHRIFKKLCLLRIKSGTFWMPFEYHLFTLFKKVKRFLLRKQAEIR